ncbi:MAG: hypothetical protein JNJ46_14905 [Myxococcales bacterium]|nr:hypothetical protein [Myxococcales bacterium]
MAKESKEAQASGKDSRPASTKVRWAWLALGLLGLLVPLSWLVLSRGAAPRAAMPEAPSPMAQAGRTNVRLDQLAETGARFAEEKRDDPSPGRIARAESGENEDAPANDRSKSEARKPAPEEPQPATRMDRSDAPKGEPVRRAKIGAKKPLSAPAYRPDPTAPPPAAERRPVSTPLPPPPAKPSAAPAPPAPPPPAAPTMSPGGGASPPVAPGPMGPATVDAKPRPPSPPKPPRVAVKTTRPPAARPARSGERQRTLSVDQDDTARSAPEVEREKKSVGASHDANRREGIGLGNIGTLGHGAGVANGNGSAPRAAERGSSDKREVPRKKSASKSAKGKKSSPAKTHESQDPSSDAEGAAPDAEDAEVASLKPGWFGTKIPSPMNLGQATNVYVTVTREENKAKGRAKLEATPPTATPAQIQEDEILVGKFLRVELRALQSEFEIQAISSSEQRLIPGKVTTWQWKVVPLQVGPRELSVVVTNLTDVRGQPIDLTVHAVTVEVQADTMHKLKSVGSLISSALGGLMSLFGMYKGVLAPLLARRRDKDGDKDKDKNKNKDKGADGDKGGTDGDGKPAASAAANGPPAASDGEKPAAGSPAGPAQS